MNYTAEAIGKFPLDELTITIGRIRGLLPTEEKVDRAVHLLAQAIKESVPGAAGTGVSLLNRDGRRTSSGFTDALVNDVHTDGRWTAWRSAVEALPVRLVVSAPLPVG